MSNWDISRGFLYISLVLPFIYVPLLRVCLIYNKQFKYKKLRREEEEERYEEKNKKRVTRRKNKKNSEKDETKKVRTYGRTVYINFDPKWIKKGLAPSKNPSE